MDLAADSCSSSPQTIDLKREWSAFANDENSTLSSPPHDIKRAKLEWTSTPPAWDVSAEQSDGSPFSGQGHSLLPDTSPHPPQDDLDAEPFVESEIDFQSYQKPYDACFGMV
jgi:hypothetical protein